MHTFKPHRLVFNFNFLKVSPPKSHNNLHPGVGGYRTYSLFERNIVGGPAKDVEERASLDKISVTFEVGLLWAFENAAPTYPFPSTLMGVWSRCQKQIQLTQRNVQSHTSGCLSNCFLFLASSQV